MYTPFEDFLCCIILNLNNNKVIEKIFFGEGKLIKISHVKEEAVVVFHGM